METLLYVIGIEIHLAFFLATWYKLPVWMLCNNGSKMDPSAIPELIAKGWDTVLELSWNSNLLWVRYDSNQFIASGKMYRILILLKAVCDWGYQKLLFSKQSLLFFVYRVHFCCCCVTFTKKAWLNSRKLLWNSMCSLSWLYTSFTVILE